MSGYAPALLLTLVIEGPCYVVGLTGRSVGGWGSAVATAAAVNLISHPLAFLVVHPPLEDAIGSIAALAITESAVVMGEAALLLLRRVPAGVALVASGCANVASLVVGAAVLG
jgi:hypothetical protein